MIVWHRIHEFSYEGRVSNVILATVWYDSPLFFNKKSATWRCLTSFHGVGVRGYGSAHPSRIEAKESIEKFINSVAEKVLTR